MLSGAYNVKIFRINVANELLTRIVQSRFKNKDPRQYQVVPILY